MKWWVLAFVIGCKSPGTITLDFDLDGTGSGGCGAPPGMAFVLYAEPGATCAACACGACAETRSGQALACPPPEQTRLCTKAEIEDSGLALAPGLWAVVLEVDDDHGTLLQSRCLDITVDADGVTSTNASNAACTTCL